MVGVGEGLAGDGPGGIPLQLMLIQQNAQHFRNGDGRVSVIKLDHFVLRQIFNFAACQMVLTQDIRHRTGALEVLLHQAQALACLVVVIRIQHLGQLGRFNALLLRLQEFTVVEITQIKRMLMRRLPQAQRLSHAIAEAQYRQIPGLAAQGKCRTPQFTAIGQFLQFPADAHIHRQRGVVAEPRVAFALPVIRRFLLLAVAKRLAEQPVLVIQPVAGGRLFHCGHRIQETGRQTPQPAIAQRRIGFLLQQIRQLDVLLRQCLLDGVIPAQVNQVVGRQATNQKLHRNVVHVAQRLTAFARCRLRSQLLGQRRAYRLPPLVLSHLLCRTEAKLLPLTGQCRQESILFKRRLGHKKLSIQ
ncbi:hypothetical protein D3C71_1299680 [compost metagenome]